MFGMSERKCGEKHLYFHVRIVNEVPCERREAVSYGDQLANTNLWNYNVLA